LNKYTGSFICPDCGAGRANHNVSKQRRNQLGERDGWTCHRCLLPIDPGLAWPHPLSPVADHYPIPRGDGGPAILANLKIAHALCNGNTASSRLRTWDSYPPDERRILEAIVKLPFDAMGHVQVPPSITLGEP
jgi:hypothetical protein